MQKWTYLSAALVVAREHPAEHDEVRAGPDGLGHVARARAAAVLQSGVA